MGSHPDNTGSVASKQLIANLDYQFFQSKLVELGHRSNEVKVGNSRDQAVANDPLAKLMSLLPALKGLVISNETLCERVKRESHRAVCKIKTYFHIFKPFSHAE